MICPRRGFNGRRPSPQCEPNEQRRPGGEPTRRRERERVHRLDDQFHGNEAAAPCSRDDYEVNPWRKADTFLMRLTKSTFIGLLGRAIKGGFATTEKSEAQQQIDPAGPIGVRPLAHNIASGDRSVDTLVIARPGGESRNSLTRTYHEHILGSIFPGDPPMLKIVSDSPSRPATTCFHLLPGLGIQEYQLLGTDRLARRARGARAFSGRSFGNPRGIAGPL